MSLTINLRIMYISTYGAVNQSIFWHACLLRIIIPPFHCWFVVANDRVEFEWLLLVWCTKSSFHQDVSNAGSSGHIQIPNKWLLYFAGMPTGLPGPQTQEPKFILPLRSRFQVIDLLLDYELRWPSRTVWAPAKLGTLEHSGGTQWHRLLNMLF